jgi:hypothetical protein
MNYILVVNSIYTNKNDPKAALCTVHIELK